jgi:MFS family permease
VEQKKYQVSKGASMAILTVVALLWMLHMADRFILIVALTPIKDAFGLTDAQAGLLPALLTAGIALIGIPAAVLSDRWARRKVISVMALTWSLFTLVTGIATQFWHLVVSRFMVGSGEAGYAPAGITWISVVFPKEMRSRIMGILFACSQLGMVIGLVFGGILISATQNWRTPFFVFAIPGIILAIIVFFLPDYKSIRKEGESMLSKSFFRDWAQVFNIPSFWLTMAAISLIQFMIIPLSSWTPTLLTRAYNMNTASAGIAFGVIQLVVLLAPVFGMLVDKWHRRFKNARPWTLAITSSLITILGLAIPLTIGAPLPLWLTLHALTTTSFAIFIPTLLSVGQDVLPLGQRATSQGVSNLAAQLTGATLGPVIVGAISDASGGGAHGIQVGLYWMVPLALLGVVASLILLKFYPADSAKISDVVAAES